jgi:LacI family transcriptional regulator
MKEEIGAKVTQKDIARLAGISTSTVSMVMRGKGNISNKIRSKIMRIAEEGGYQKPLSKEEKQDRKSVV